MKITQTLRGFAESLRDRVGFWFKSLQIFYAQDTIPQSLTSGRTNGLSSNVLMSPVMWLMRAFTEAQLVVQRRRTDSGGGIIWDRAVDHEVEILIDRPNDAYDGDALWKSTALSWTINGNAYWRKVRNAFGDVVQLWYIPHWMVHPRWPADGSVFISHYEMSTGLGPPVHLPPRDVVHFRFGLDPENTRLGYSPLRSILREVMTDDEAARFSEKILENMGVPGLVVSPETGEKINDADRDRFQNFMDHAFRGDRRGMALVMGKPTKVAQFGFNPNQIMLPNLRDISEERVCAALGIPSAVVGFGSGLQSTKVGATMRELVKLAWNQCVTPMQTSLGRQLTAQLLPDFVGPSFRRVFRARFDVSEVSAFTEEAKAEAERVALLVREGILRVDRAQHILGLEVDQTRQVYLKSETATVDDTEPDAEDDDGDVRPEAAAEEDRDDAADQKLLRGLAARFLSAPTNNGHR